MSDSTDYPSSSNSSHSSRRLDSSSLMSSGSSPTLHLSSGPMSYNSSGSSSPEFLGYFIKSSCKKRSPSPTKISLPPSPTWSSSSSPSVQLNPEVDLQFGRCLTPDSLPASLFIGLAEKDVSQPTSPAVSSSGSTSEDEAVEAKRLRIDPDYIPSTASEGTLTATNSQVTSEEEKEEEEKEETETEEEESWHPSGCTSPESISTPEED
jgi:hypothetical protein